VSERESGVGTFVLGVALGVVAGLLLAPERGKDLRGRLSRRLQRLGARATDGTRERPQRPPRASEAADDPGA
jgi:gas vesicle protein